MEPWGGDGVVLPGRRMEKRKRWRRRGEEAESSDLQVDLCRRSSLLRVTANAGSESCVAVKEGFADEEDYIKSGCSELVFVQMQQNKAMEKQSSLPDKLLPISIGNQVLDLVVIGCGPAGLALSAESAKLGLNVGLIGPDLPFTNNYGVWEDEFKDLGLAGCIEHVWQDTIVYLDNDDPILIGRAYGQVSRPLLCEKLLRRCVESGVLYLNLRVESIDEGANGHSLVVCEQDIVVPCRLATVALVAASGKLLLYVVGGPKVLVQTAYGVEVEIVMDIPVLHFAEKLPGISIVSKIDDLNSLVLGSCALLLQWLTTKILLKNVLVYLSGGNNPYDPSLMVFMDYRDYMKQKVACLEAEYPTFLYAMSMSPTKVFFEETCLASEDAMPFGLLKKKLLLRLKTMGIQILKTYEEEWAYVPVGGSLPNTEQKNLAFGAAGSMVHPATVRSLSEAPKYASVITSILKQDNSKGILSLQRNNGNISMLAWNTLWPQERKRQRAFFLFGLALIVQLDVEGIRTFLRTFFRLPNWMWQGFLGSSLSSVDLVVFAFYMFVITPNNLRMNLIRHLLSDPTGATMIRTYLAV